MGLESTNHTASPHQTVRRALDHEIGDPAGLRMLKLAVGVHVLIAALATIQRLVVGSQINNFLIFRGSFFHLLSGQDLYAAYPLEHFDFYKYSPTWALLFAPFALPPVPVGLVLWNVVNAGVLAIAMTRLLPARAAAFALGIVFFEALGAVQNAQSNGLAAALMIFALIASEHAQPRAGAFSIAVGTSIKLFPIGAGLFGVLARPCWRHVGWCVAAGAILLALPLAVTSFDTLLTQYASWRAISARDTLSIEQAWVGGIVETYLGRAVPHGPFQVAGVLWMLASSAYASRAWDHPTVRRLLLASLLGFATIFNHKGESPTYVIAFAGIGIWWSIMPRARWRDVIVLAAFVLGSLGGTDLFPRAYRVAYHHGWQLKALTASLAWVAMQWDLWRTIRRPSLSHTNA
ncbi:MAG: DUF2029 domain-containing protein [Gemmatimonadaceae bacterium]|nr:DUF2029 domain-containing protein [Gemmatimonadaceae bacterium]